MGERSAAPRAGPWQIDISGEVEEPYTLPLGELFYWPSTELVVDIHCVTRWSTLGVKFRGVLLADLLSRARPRSAARYVSFVAASEREHSTSLPLADALELRTLIAFAVNGEPLDAARGGPVRVVTPRRYFYKSLKWLKRLELLAEDRLGYWEATAGYHNEADPWREQRYVALGLSRPELQRLLAARDFSGLHLRSLRLAGHDLAGLLAVRALLRDADFRDASLSEARFDGANLSNAHFQGAVLSGATFLQADVEGANFAGADLRGADFRGASLTAATFIERGTAGEPLAARLDAATRFDFGAEAMLTPDQSRWLRQHASPPGR